MKKLTKLLNYSTYAVLLCGLLLITSCKGDAKSSVQEGDFKIELLFEKDGCKMYRFKDAGDFIYWSNCDGRTEYSYTQSNGKTSHSVHIQSLTSTSRL